ncbi:4Fe-4S binding protein [Chloroflexota bacterium]
MALVHYDRCRPQGCDGGVCVAVKACPHKLLQQENAYEVPMPNPSLCRGCGDCARACPTRAIEISRT